jgi:anaerobic selenocysteine-containing dehydrogenase
VLMSPDDATRLGVEDGARIELHSDHGSFVGRTFIVPITPGNLEVHWPEGLVLLSAESRDLESGVPDYNTWVRVDTG